VCFTTLTDKKKWPSWYRDRDFDEIQHPFWLKKKNFQWTKNRDEFPQSDKWHLKKKEGGKNT
jgi:hypothetical protein